MMTEDEAVQFLSAWDELSNAITYLLTTPFSNASVAIDKVDRAHKKMHPVMRKCTWEAFHPNHKGAPL